MFSLFSIPCKITLDEGREIMGFSQAVKTSINGDEYYTPQNAVDMIVPYIIGGGV